MPGEPVTYTDKGGGGELPPHGEDFFNRIINVHWPKRGGGTEGLFVAGFNWMYGDKFNVYAGTASQDPEKPGFALGGQDQISDSDYQAQIYFSNGGNFSQVWADPDTVQSDADRWDSFVQAMVWNPDTKTFYAEVWQSHNHYTERDDGFSYLKYLKNYMALFSSSNGTSWGAAGKEMVYYYDGGDGYGAGTTVLDNQGRGGPGLIGPYCSGTAKESNGNPLPDGVFSYWEIKDLDGSIIESGTAVIDPPLSFNHEGGGITNPSSTNIVLTHFKKGFAPTVTTVSPGIYLQAVAFVGTVLVAVGGDNAPAGYPDVPWGPGQIAVSNDVGKTWKTMDVGTQGFYPIVIGAPVPPSLKPAIYAFSDGFATKVGDLADILSA